MKGRGRTDGRAAAPLRAQLPLLDRLIDDAPDRSDDPPLSAAAALAALEASLRRDLEALLNAHRRWRSWPEAYGELKVSPVAWGVSDFTAGAFNDPRRREELRAEVEETIRRFERRLTRVRVSLVAAKDPLAATLRLRIDGLLRVEPQPEPIAFDTLIDAATAAVEVQRNALLPPFDDV
jgi:type VI secretion system protein ImpF